MIKEIKNPRSLVIGILAIALLAQCTQRSTLESEIKEIVGVKNPPCDTQLYIEGLTNPLILSIGEAEVKIEINKNGEVFLSGEGLRYGDQSGPNITLGEEGAKEKLALLSAEEEGSKVKARISIICKESKSNNPPGTESMPNEGSLSNNSLNALGKLIPIPTPTSEKNFLSKREPSSTLTPPSEQKPRSNNSQISCIEIDGEKVSTAYRAWLLLGKPETVFQVREGQSKTIEDTDGNGEPNLTDEIREPKPFQGVRKGDKFCALVNTR